MGQSEQGIGATFNARWDITDLVLEMNMGKETIRMHVCPLARPDFLLPFRVRFRIEQTFDWGEEVC